MESERVKIDGCAANVTAVIEQKRGDAKPTRDRVSKVEERFESLKGQVKTRMNDLRERKIVLERMIKVVDEANDWSMKTTEKLGDMVASYPDLQESKQQIVVIEVNFLWRFEGTVSHSY